MVYSGTWHDDDDHLDDPGNGPALVSRDEDEKTNYKSFSEEEIEQIKKRHSELTMEADALVAELTKRITDTPSKEAWMSDEQNQGLREVGLNLQNKQKHVEEYRRILEEVERRRVAVEVLRATKEVGIQGMLQSIAAAEHVDLAFILDCTLSMKKYIESVKNCIIEVVNHVRSTNKNLVLRLAVVAYRDLQYCVPMEVCDFDESVSRFINFLSRLKAGGPLSAEIRDTAEDVASGLKKARSLHWSSPTKVVVLIADSPCHGMEFHNGQVSDNYPNGTPGVDVRNELLALSRIGTSPRYQNSNITSNTMNLFFGRIGPKTDIMMEVFEKNCPISSFSMKEKNAVVSGITDCLRCSIFRTISCTVQVKPFSVQDDDDEEEEETNKTTISWANNMNLNPPVNENEWANLPTANVMTMCNFPIRSLAQLKQQVRTGWMARMSGSGTMTQRCLFLKRAPQPFAEGGSRLAFWGRLCSRRNRLVSPDCLVVLKTFKRHVAFDNQDEPPQRFIDQMEISNVARFLAKEYNKSLDRPVGCAPIQFLEARVVEERIVKSRNNNGIGKATRRFFCAEKPLPSSSTSSADGNFIHFSNNTGYWDAQNLDETLLRFSKFTFEKTDGYLMVVDLQGVKNLDEEKDGFCYYLTDPAIHCTDITRFGSTNLGVKLMLMCLESTNAYLKEMGWD